MKLPAYNTKTHAGKLWAAIYNFYTMNIAYTFYYCVHADSIMTLINFTCI